MVEKSSVEQGSSKWGIILLTGFVSLLVGVATALIVDYVRTSAAKLEYDIVSSSSFLGQTQKIGLAVVQIQNTGRKEIESVTAKISAKGTEVLETKLEGFPTHGLTEQKLNDTYLLEIPYLNRSESGRILLLFSLTSQEFAPPTVELRARGVTGIPRTKDEKSSRYGVSIAAIGAGLASLSSLLAFTTLLRLRFKRVLTSHSDDQRDVAAFVLDA